MKETLKDLFGFMYSLSMGGYFFFIGRFLLIVLFIYIIYLLKTEPEELPKKKEEKFDISKVTKNLEENYKPATPNIKLTSYEEDLFDKILLFHLCFQDTHQTMNQLLLRHN